MRPIKTAALILVASGALALSACATSPYGNGYYGNSGYPTSSNAAYQGYGTVTSVRQVTVGTSSGLGTVGGAIIGGVLGNQVGDGDGRKLATVGGAVAGGVIGNRIEQNRNTGTTGQQITVRLDSGYSVTVTQPGYGFRSGDRVLVSGSGNSARVTYR